MTIILRYMSTFYISRRVVYLKIHRMLKEYYLCLESHIQMTLHVCFDIKISSESKHFFYFCVNSQFARAFTICIWKYSLVVAYLCATIRNANAPTLFCNLQYSCTECKGCNIICKIVNFKGKILKIFV